MASCFDFAMTNKLLKNEGEKLAILTNTGHYNWNTAQTPGLAVEMYRLHLSGLQEIKKEHLMKEKKQINV